MSVKAYLKDGRLTVDQIRYWIASRPTGVPRSGPPGNPQADTRSAAGTRPGAEPKPAGSRT